MQKYTKGEKLRIVFLNPVHSEYNRDHAIKIGDVYTFINNGASKDLIHCNNSKGLLKVLGTSEVERVAGITCDGSSIMVAPQDAGVRVDEEWPEPVGGRIPIGTEVQVVSHGTQGDAPIGLIDTIKRYSISVIHKKFYGYVLNSNNDRFYKHDMLEIYDSSTSMEESEPEAAMPEMIVTHADYRRNNMVAAEYSDHYCTKSDQMGANENVLQDPLQLRRDKSIVIFKMRLCKEVRHYHKGE